MRPSRILAIYFLLLVPLRSCRTYRIFAIFPIQGRSHFNVLEPLLKALAEKGHQVDVVSSFPLKKPFDNYNDIVKLRPANLTAFFEYDQFSSRKVHKKSVHVYELKTCIDTLGNPEVKKIIDNPKFHYDLVLTQVSLFVKILYR